MSQFINLQDCSYPALLRQIRNPPERIYYKGNYNEVMSESFLSVVGSRKMSLYGRKVIDHIFSGLAFSGISIVSGFMYGVDACAHETAMKYGLKTIAVMPCGIEYVHPEDQVDLYNIILDSGGMIISEYEGVFKPKRWVYPKRNRIVAGLSKAVLVIEAEENSGSLITAEYAHGFGRKVYAVPGSIFSSVSNGTLCLINSYAVGINSSEDILKLYGQRESADKREFGLFEYNNNTDQNTAKSSAVLEDRILEMLHNSPQAYDELSLHIGCETAELSKTITLMSLRGLIEEEGGKFYAC